MSPTSSPTWADYRGSIGDLSSLFAALVEHWPIQRALYPGSYLDLSPSTAIRDVAYADVDKRAARYFSSPDAAASELAAATTRTETPSVSFLHADYTRPIAVADRSVDLLISLHAGLVWDHCERYLAPGGLLLSNTSHGDASVAALDPRLELVGVAQHRGDRYRIEVSELDEYLVPRQPEKADAELIRRSGRGIAYTRTAFAYVFLFDPSR